MRLTGWLFAYTFLYREGPQQVFQMRDFLKSCRTGFRILKQNAWGQDSGLRVCSGCGMPIITVGITGLSENLDQVDEIKRDPLYKNA